LSTFRFFKIKYSKNVVNIKTVGDGHMTVEAMNSETHVFNSTARN
jgi:hypothetical protein